MTWKLGGLKKNYLLIILWVWKLGRTQLDIHISLTASSGARGSTPKMASLSICLGSQCLWPLPLSSPGISSSRTSPPYGMSFSQNGGLRAIALLTVYLASKRQEAEAARPFLYHAQNWHSVTSIMLHW